MVSDGYPEEFEKNKRINGLNEVLKTHVFHAGMKKKQDNYFTDGGRVLSVTATSKNIDRSLQKIYSEIEKIKFYKSYFRKDIGHEVLESVT